MKLKETIMIAIAGLAFMLITGVAKANPVLNWFEAEKIKLLNTKKNHGQIVRLNLLRQKSQS